jgi:hypothetical protein
MLEVTPRMSRGRDKFFSTSSNIRLKSLSIRLRFDAKEEELAMAAYNRRAEGLRPPHRGRSDRENNPVLGEIRGEETIPFGQRLSRREARDQQQQRGRPHLPWRGRTRVESNGQQKFRKPHQGFFSFSFGAGIRFAPSKHAGSPDNGWIGRKDRSSVSKTAEAVIKGL